MQKRLGIIVPYRDRKQHLDAFLPHTCTYFARDKIDREIPVSIYVIEQPPGLPFNRGLLKNIGFLIAREHCDYVCFHDVDYLPVWADYSYPELPTMIIWHGLETLPIDPANPSLGAITNNVGSMFSAVVLCPNHQFAEANGYSHEYWGWGMEDYDLRRRLELNGLAVAHRKGTFQALVHRHHGFVGHNSVTNRPIPSEDSARNDAVFHARWSEPDRSRDTSGDDGLTSAQFRVVDRRSLSPSNMERQIAVELIQVEFEHRPR